MPERETREFVTPGGHKAVLRTYLTGREANDIKQVIFSAVKMDSADLEAGGKVNMGGLSGTLIVEQEKKAMGYVLKSFDGNEANPLDALLDLPASEYNAVLAEVNKIQNPTTPQK